jgi:glycosyltransferase involved in cell wall biosynthesis
VSRTRRTGGRLAVAHLMPWSGMGGVEIATLRMVEAIRGEFDQVAFCLPDAKVTESFAEAGVPTVSYLPPALSVRSAAQYYRDSFVIARQLRSLGIDIVHFAETKAAEHNSLAATLAGCKMVCHVRNTYPELTLRQRLPLLPVDCFIFVSKEARREFGVSLDDAKARVIYDAIELPDDEAMGSRAAVRSELGIPEDCIVIGMVARVNPQKDYFTLAAAAAKVVGRQRNVRFLVVGDNSLVDMNRLHYKAVMEELDRLGIRDQFVFTGHRSDVYRLIAAMDISVLATHREGFGLCLAESMVMQKPVVATAVGGILDFVENDVTGLLYAHGDANGLADAILSLIHDRDSAERLGMAGYDYVERNYSRQKFVREISATYREVARDRTFADAPATAGAKV